MARDGMAVTLAMNAIIRQNNTQMRSTIAECLSTMAGKTVANVTRHGAFGERPDVGLVVTLFIDGTGIMGHYDGGNFGNAAHWEWYTFTPKAAR